MPELPEVETTLRGIRPYLLSQTVSHLQVRERRLRWPVEDGLEKILENQRILDVTRRAKYLLIACENGTLIVHLGMSGSLRLVEAHLPCGKHEHIDLVLSNGRCLRYRDPRRFGAWLWTTTSPCKHVLLAKLGPEPLTHAFSSHYLFNVSRRRKQSIKTFVMDSHIVVGIGNIYANESLFIAGILPLREAGSLTKNESARLVCVLRDVLTCAIQRGGTTLRDFVGVEGALGYFAQELQVYGRGGLPCTRCQGRLLEAKLGQRSTVWCPQCQI